MQWWLIAGWAVVVVGAWELFRSPVFPSMADIVGAVPVLWFRDGLGAALVKSMTINVQAILLSTLISLPLAYASRVPVFAPAAHGLSKLRFLSPAVFFLILLFLTTSGRQVKLLMLVAGQTFFLVTSMVGVVQRIPPAQFDDARTLRMSEWLGMWFVVVRGTADKAMEAIRDNAAIGWSMLMMVEGFVRSEGGVGVLLLNQEKFLNFAQVYAIAAAIIAVGILQDWALALTRDALFPYAALQEKRA
jgi:NitT/TauT family transport system permease protein